MESSLAEKDMIEVLVEAKKVNSLLGSSTGHSREQPSSGKPALSRWLDFMISSGALNSLSFAFFPFEESQP